MPFTTWKDLYQEMLNDMADRSWRFKEYELGDRRVLFTSPTEFRQQLAFVKEQMFEEQNSYDARTYAAMGSDY